MPVMNFDLEDGLPPVSFSINGEGAERMMNFMSECQQDRDAHAMLTKEIAELRAKVESLAADAERYSTLFSDSQFNRLSVVKFREFDDPIVFTKNQANQHLDAAIAEGKKHD